MSKYRTFNVGSAKDIRICTEVLICCESVRDRGADRPRASQRLAGDSTSVALALYTLL